MEILSNSAGFSTYYMNILFNSQAFCELLASQRENSEYLEQLSAFYLSCGLHKEYTKHLERKKWIDFLYFSHEIWIQEQSVMKSIHDLELENKGMVKSPDEGIRRSSRLSPFLLLFSLFLTPPQKKILTIFAINLTRLILFALLLLLLLNSMLCVISRYLEKHRRT